MKILLRWFLIKFNYVFRIFKSMRFLLAISILSSCKSSLSSNRLTLDIEFRMFFDNIIRKSNLANKKIQKYKHINKLKKVNISSHDNKDETKEYPSNKLTKQENNFYTPKEQSKNKIRIYGDDSTSINAYVSINHLGSEYMVVHKGLIEKCTAEEAIAVIFHEMGHVKKSHIKQSIFKISKAQNYKLLMPTLLIPGINILGMIVINGIYNDLMMYSQQQEVEADSYALQTLQKLNWTVSGSYKLFKKFAENDKARDYFSSHPSSSNRQKMAFQYLKKEEGKIPDEIISHYKALQSRISKGLYIGGKRIGKPSNEYEKLWEGYLSGRDISKSLVEFLQKLDENSPMYVCSTYIKFLMELRLENYENALQSIQIINQKFSDREVEFCILYTKFHSYKKSKNTAKMKNLEHELLNYKNKDMFDVRIWSLLCSLYDFLGNRSHFYYAKAYNEFVSSGDIYKVNQFLKKALDGLNKNSIAFQECEYLQSVSRKARV